MGIGRRSDVGDCSDVVFGAYFFIKQTMFWTLNVPSYHHCRIPSCLLSSLIGSLSLSLVVPTTCAISMRMLGL